VRQAADRASGAGWAQVQGAGAGGREGESSCLLAARLATRSQGWLGSSEGDWRPDSRLEQAERRGVGNEGRILFPSPTTLNLDRGCGRARLSP
jgi:hypothetical protein